MVYLLSVLNRVYEETPLTRTQTPTDTNTGILVPTQKHVYIKRHVNKTYTYTLLSFLLLQVYLILFKKFYTSSICDLYVSLFFPMETALLVKYTNYKQINKQYIQNFIQNFFRIPIQIYLLQIRVYSVFPIETRNTINNKKKN